MIIPGANLFLSSCTGLFSLGGQRCRIRSFSLPRFLQNRTMHETNDVNEEETTRRDREMEDISPERLVKKRRVADSVDKNISRGDTCLWYFRSAARIDEKARIAEEPACVHRPLCFLWDGGANVTSEKLERSDDPTTRLATELRALRAFAGTLGF